MKELLKASLILFVLSAGSAGIVTGCSSTSESTNKPGKTTIKRVAVMPFENQISYPYGGDEVRQAFIRAFLAKNVEIEESQDKWEKVLKLDFSLWNMNPAQVEVVAKLLDVDFVVYGRSDLNQLFPKRIVGYNFDREVIKPVEVKIYQASDNSIAFQERKDLYSSWGYVTTIKTIDELATETVSAMVDRGYISNN